MTRILATLCAALLSAGPALAANVTGDAAKGEDGFKKCRSCHSIVSDAGDVIVKGGRTGPNLWGIAGRQAGTEVEFKFGPDIVAAGEAGLSWTEESFASYTQDPKAFLADYLDDSKAKSKMTFRLKSGAEDIWAYLVSLGPEAVGN